jgi:hypothetical protein
MPKLHSLNGNSYQVITNFEDSNEKECIKMDKKNEKIYLQLLAQAESAEKKLRNSVLSFNLEIPPPPRPCNRDRFNLWKKRNVSKPVIEQSQSVLFLNSQGYELETDYEAYQAIDLAKEIKKEQGVVDTNNDDKTKLFDNVFTLDDGNLMRRRSSIKMKSLERKKQYEESLGVPSAPMAPEPTFTSFNNSIYPSFNNFEVAKPSAPPLTRNFMFPDKSTDFSF